MNKISAYIISYNRKDVIEACIKSLWFADEIVLVDKSSTDSTVAIAAKYADIVKIVPWTPTVEETRQFAESLCSHDWIIFLDDDEVLNSCGAQYVQEILANPKSYVYKFPRNEYILSRHSKSAYYYPNTQIRMYKKGAIKFSPLVHNGFQLLINSIHEIELSSGVCIDHFSHYDVSEWISKANKYTSIKKRARFYEFKNNATFLEYIQGLISRWLSKNNDGETYENIVATLRGVYDVIDYCKDWELNNISEDEMSKWVSIAVKNLKIPTAVNLLRSDQIDASQCEKIDEALVHNTYIEYKFLPDTELYCEYEAVEERNRILKHENAELSVKLQQIQLSNTYRIVHCLAIVKSGIVAIVKKLIKKHRAKVRKIYFSNLFPDYLRKNFTKLIMERAPEFVGLSNSLKVYDFPDEIQCNIILRYLSFPKYSNPKLSIIIPAYGKLPIILNCLRSIRNNPPKCEYEVIVADDASRDVKILQLKNIDGLKFYQNKENLGFTKNCNNAVKKSNAEYIYLLNDDTQIFKNTINALLDTFNELNVGLVGSKLIYPDLTLQEAGGIVWKDGTAWNYGRNMNPNELGYNFSRDVDYCSGASLMIKRDIFSQVGLFDESYAPAYCEDTDLAFKIRSIGLRVVYQPLSIVMHFEGRSHGTDISVGLKSFQAINQRKFYEKWRDILEKNHFENGENLSRAIYGDKKSDFVLFVDNNVPFFDKDAGSRTLIELMRIFKNNGYIVHFIPLNGSITDDAFRLQSLGIQVIKTSAPLSYIGANQSLYSILFLSRPEPAFLVLKNLKLNPDKVYFYGHDIHYLRHEKKLSLQGIDDGISELRRKENYVWESSSHILYPSTEEVDVVRNYLHTLGKVAHIDKLPVYVSRSLSFKSLPGYDERAGLLFVGSSHDPNIDAVKFFIDEILPEINKSNSQILLHIVGTVCDALKKSNNVILHGLVSKSELELLYLNSRVFVAPLRYGMGVKGKLIDAFDFGCPIVTTSIGAQGLEGAELVIANDAQQFANEAMNLYLSSEKWTEISMANLDYVSKNYTVSNIKSALGVQ